MKADERYDTRLDVKFGPLALIDEKALTDAQAHPWFNQTLCEVNGSVVRVGKVQGEYHWHKHDHDDEFFFVVEGELHIEVENKPTVTLKPRQGVVIPKGVLHRPFAPTRTVMLMVETKSITPTGD